MSSYDASLFVDKALWNKVCFVAVLLVLICICSIHPSQQTNRHGNLLSNSYNEFRFGSPSQWKAKSARRLVPHLHVLRPSNQTNRHGNSLSISYKWLLAHAHSQQLLGCLPWHSNKFTQNWHVLDFISSLIMSKQSFSTTNESLATY